jgi:hypothetical protein
MITFDPNHITSHHWTREDVTALTDEDLQTLTDDQLGQLADCAIITGYWNWGRPGWTIIPTDIQPTDEDPHPIPTTGPFDGHPF